MPRRTIGIICTSPGWGGLELNTIRLCNWLNEAGWKVHLIGVKGNPILQNSSEQSYSVSTFGEGALPKKGAQLRALHAWVQRYKIHVLFVPYNKDIAIASLYKRFYDGDIGLVYQQHMQVGVRKRDLIHTLRYAMIDIWVSPLQYLKEETLRLTRVPEEKIEVIPFGIEPEKFQNSTWTRGSARKELSLPEDAFIIGLLGRIDPKKGQDTIIKALQKLEEKGNYHVLLMGSVTLNEGGDQFSRQLQDLVANTGLKERVHFKPYTSDVMQFFRAIDVFAMPAHGETFGMVTVEAMAAGVPVIGTGTDGTKEILGDGRFGYLFEKENPDDFIRQLNALQANNELDNLVKEAQNEAFSQYSKQKMMDSLAAVLDELITDQ